VLHSFYVVFRSSIEIQEPVSEIRDDVIEVNPANVQALEPVAELPHSPAPSAKSTPHTTPKTSMKFKKEGKETKPFEFGKSKFSSKHEVVKRGKSVEVKLESLKLTKEDTLRIVVLPPRRNQLSAAVDTQPELETKVKRSGSKYEITFKPVDVGTHKVFAYVNEIQHPLSPFPIRVYDSGEIIVGEIPAQSNLNDTVEFTVDAGRAGFGNLEMAIKDADGIIIPSHVAQLESGTAKFLVTFTPTSRGPHTVNITFNKEVLKNSPFEVLITDPPAPLNDTVDGTGSPSLSKKEMKKEKEDKKKEEKERVKREKEEKGATLKKDKKSRHRVVSKTSVTKIPSLSRVGQPSNIIVEVAGHDQLEIVITDSKKNQIGTELIEIEPGVMQVNFTPQVVGDHDIEVKYGGVPVTPIPFTCRAYDPAKIKVGTIPKGLLEKPVYFTVDASEAGVGNLEVAVNDGRVPSMAHALGQHRYDISFVPKENVDHTITIRFNNEPVPGSPFTCQLVAAAQASASGPGLERVPVDEPTEIKIQTIASEAQPEVRVRDPMGIDLPVEIMPSEKDKTVCTVKYTPKCVGNHQVDISMLGEPIAGSPFTAKAYDARMALLSECDHAVVGKPCTFAIDAARAGAGNMEIIVSVDNHNVPNFVQAEGQAKFKVSFTPQEAKEHVISVRFNGVSVPGEFICSPMKCMVEKASSTAVTPAVTSPVATELSSVTRNSSEEISKYSLTKELENAQVFFVVFLDKLSVLGIYLSNSLQ
uniref:Calponin-homology (CH) domain-containing protein n=1 Tax=Angiostrongylus cantonensis TaxID=6313 RepID=A0A0K0DPG2_ANGCA